LSDPEGEKGREEEKEGGEERGGFDQVVQV
jgi:hypothetical protein